MKKALLFLLLAIRCFGSDPISAARLPYGGTWSNLAGVTGGIPTGQTVYTNLTSTISDTALNAAIAACPSNQVVLLGSGFYTNKSITMTKNGVVLRGSVDANGKPSTIFTNLSFNGISVGSGFYIADTTGWYPTNVSSGFTRGSTTVTLAGIPTGCVAGALLWFSAPTNTTTVNGGSFALFLGTDPYIQIVKVTGVSGNDVSFYPAINADFLTAMKASTPKSTVYSRIGIENLVMTDSNLTYVLVNGADEGWMKNCILTNSPAGSVRQIYLNTVNRFEIRECEFGYIDAAGSDAYSIFNADCTGVLTENNYFHNSPNFYPQLGAQNCVFSYNFLTNVPYALQPGWLSQIVYNHGCMNEYNLYEGNVIPTYYDDGLLNNINDPTSTRVNVHLRERILGWDGSDGGKIYNAHGITIFDPGVSNSIAGCLIGTIGFHVSYATWASSSSTPIYGLDVNVPTTLGRYGNWNAFDVGINSGETLSGGQTVANSYLYTSKPSWFANMQWPPFDTTRTNVAQMSATNIPAGFRFAFGTSIPSISSVVIDSTGTNITVQLSTTCTNGPASGNDWAPSMTGGSATWTYASGSGGSTFTLISSRTILLNETGSMTYSAPGNGTRSTGNIELPTLSGVVVINNSTRTGWTGTAPARLTQRVRAASSGQ